MKRKTVLLTILLSLVHIYCQDSVELNNMGRECIDALSKVPSVLEYLIDAMQERPAILEKDDYSVTEDDILESSRHTEQDGHQERAKKHVKARNIYARIAPVARVTPEDVMRQVLKVQKKLEEKRNHKKIKRDTSESQDAHMMIGTFQAIMQPMAARNRDNVVDEYQNYTTNPNT